MQLKEGLHAAETPEQDDAPRSASSAMPDLASPNVPRLRARVHGQLPPAACAGISLGAVEFRPLQECDYEEMVALHTEWFPVSYDENFYSKSVHGDIFTIAATYTARSASASSTTPAAASEAEDVQEHLLGIITMSTACEMHGDDIMSILGGDCEALCCQPPDDPRGAVVRRGCLAYILTLGVIDGFRRRGLAKELLRRAVEHVDRRLPHVQAVYLHVVTYNEAAIRLYEALNFLQLGRFVSFYVLHGSPYDSFLYALYVHGGKPPWKWRLKNLLGLGQVRGGTWKSWMWSAWSSWWRREAVEDDEGRIEAASP